MRKKKDSVFRERKSEENRDFIFTKSKQICMFKNLSALCTKPEYVVVGKKQGPSIVVLSYWLNDLFHPYSR